LLKTKSRIFLNNFPAVMTSLWTCEATTCPCATASSTSKMPLRFMQPSPALLSRRVSKWQADPRRRRVRFLARSLATGLALIVEQPMSETALRDSSRDRAGSERWDAREMLAIAPLALWTVLRPVAEAWVAHRFLLRAISVVPSEQVWKSPSKTACRFRAGDPACSRGTHHPSGLTRDKIVHPRQPAEPVKPKRRASKLRRACALSRCLRASTGGRHLSVSLYRPRVGRDRPCP
jgi:hypothetical protein